MDLHETRRLPSPSFDGTSQSERTKATPGESGFRIAGRPLSERLAMAAGTARRFGFMETDGRICGDWYGLFTADPTTLLAIIGHADIEERVRGLGVERGVCRQLSGERAEAFGIRLSALIRDLDTWYRELVACPGEGVHPVLRLLSGLIVEHLKEPVARLHRTALKMARETGRPPFLDAGALHGIWGMETAVFDKSDDGATVLDTGLVHPFWNAAMQVRKAARLRIGETLDTGTHDPAAGLLIAFMELLERGERALDGFLHLHRDLYYNRILGAEDRPAEPDRVLLLAPSDATVGTPLSEQTEIAAGDRSARICERLRVQPGRIARIETLFFEHHPSIFPEVDLGIASSIRHAVFSPETVEAEGFRLFGAPHRLSPMEEGGDARVGLAMGARIFGMAEGRRSLVLTLDFDPPSPALSARLDQTVAAVAKARKVGPEGALHLVFRRAFRFRMTGEDGWHAVEDPGIFPIRQAGAFRMEIRLALDPKAPPIRALDPGVHGDAFSAMAGQPVLSMVLDPDAPVCLHSLLSRLNLARVRIASRVRGVRNLEVANQIGPLDAQTAFSPFGPIPKVGSRWVVGHAESAALDCTRVSLRICWEGLPTGPGGLAAHYRTHGLALENETFRARVAVLRDGEWVDDPEEKPHALFATRPESSGRTDGTIRIDITRRALLGAVARRDGGAGSRPGNGALSLRLAAPDTAFGHATYPELLTRRLMQQAKGRKFVPLPLAPYTPTIGQMALDYEAEARFLPGAPDGPVTLFHLHPSGCERLDNRNEGEAITLLPDGGGLAHTAIGIAGTRLSGRTNLVFRMEEASGERTGDPDLLFTWSVLENDGWRPLPPGSLLADGTDGFRHSGVLVLDLPELTERAHSVMASGMLWLRVTAAGKQDTSIHDLQGSLGALGRCRKIALNGTEARLDDHRETGLPAEAVFLPRVPVLGITRLVLVETLPCGRPAETEPQRVMRMAERLRHKGRAVTSWDVEHLLLEAYPAIWKAKCFSAMDRDGQAAPGRLLVSVLAGGGGRASRPPLFSSGMLLEMTRFLSARLPAHAKVTVINPSFERIQVRATLLFHGKDGDALRRVHRSLSDFLSPWVENVGYGPVFGWTIREAEILAHLEHHPDVVAVTNLSLLQLVRRMDGVHQRIDTALGETIEDRGLPEAGRSLGPVEPWSIAIPASAHVLDTMDTPASITATPTGIGELEIGRTFIL